MLHLKRRPLTPEQEEQRRTKDFFDRILPGTIRFLTDHYIVGDSYRCVWALREYPPSTEEQAVLAQSGNNWTQGGQAAPFFRVSSAYQYFPIPDAEKAVNKLITGNNPGW